MCLLKILPLLLHAEAAAAADANQLRLLLLQILTYLSLSPRRDIDAKGRILENNQFRLPSSTTPF